jgi:hypothetical protein
MGNTTPGGSVKRRLAMGPNACEMANDTASGIDVGIRLVMRTC